MEPSDLVKTLRKGWLVIVAGLLLGAAAGFGATLATPPEYTSATKLFVAVRTGDTASATDVSQGNSAAQQKVRSYADIVGTGSVLQPVIDELGLDTTVARLARSVSTTISTNTVVVTIAVSGPSAAETARVADAVGASFTKVVERLETPAPGAASLVSVSPVQQAVVPTVPSGPNRNLNMAVGAIIGLIAGFGLAVLRSVLDTRVHGPREIGTATDAPMLGTIGADPNIRKEPLIVRADPRNPLAEAYRTLRTNLQFVDLASGGGTFVVTSAMPSEGKTTTTANLAVALAETGAKVALVDADLRRPRTAEVMGVESAVGLTDLLIGRAELDDVLQPWGHTALSVLPAGRIPPNPSELLGSPAMRALLELLSAQFDYVLLDAPPLLPVTDAAVLAQLTSGAVVVAAARQSRTTQLRSALDRLERVDARVLGIVMSKAPLRTRQGYAGAYGRYYGRDAEVVTDQRSERRGRRQRDLDASGPAAIAEASR